MSSPRGPAKDWTIHISYDANNDRWRWRIDDIRGNRRGSGLCGSEKRAKKKAKKWLESEIAKEELIAQRQPKSYRLESDWEGYRTLQEVSHSSPPTPPVSKAAPRRKTND